MNKIKSETAFSFHLSATPRCPDSVGGFLPLYQPFTRFSTNCLRIRKDTRPTITVLFVRIERDSRVGREISRRESAAWFFPPFTVICRETWMKRLMNFLCFVRGTWDRQLGESMLERVTLCTHICRCSAALTRIPHEAKPNLRSCFTSTPRTVSDTIEIMCLQNTTNQIHTAQINVKVKSSFSTR